MSIAFNMASMQSRMGAQLFPEHFPGVSMLWYFLCKVSSKSGVWLGYPLGPMSPPPGIQRVMFSFEHLHKWCRSHWIYLNGLSYNCLNTATLKSALWLPSLLIQFILCATYVQEWGCISATSVKEWGCVCVPPVCRYEGVCPQSVLECVPWSRVGRVYELIADLLVATFNTHKPTAPLSHLLHLFHLPNPTIFTCPAQHTQRKSYE